MGYLRFVLRAQRLKVLLALIDKTGSILIDLVFDYFRQSITS